MSPSVAAAGLLSSEPDSADYYSFDFSAPLVTLAESRAYPDDRVTLFGTEFVLNNGIVQSVNGIKPADLNFTNFSNIFGRTLANIDTAITTSESSLAAYLKTIDSNLAFYLPRLDASTDELEGKLNNLYASLQPIRDYLYWFSPTRTANQGPFAFYDSVYNYDSGYMNVSFASGTFGEWAQSISRSITNILRAVHPGILDLRALIGTTNSLLTFVRSDLVGTDRLTTFDFLLLNEDGELAKEEVQVDNLLDALGLLGSFLQNPLAKLQYVLADDDDIALKDATKENQDSFQDNFTGEGDGSVSGSDIGDMAGFVGNVKDTFSGAGKITDSLGVLNDSNTYWFFSQEVADDLDQVGSPAVVSEDDPLEALLSDVDVDEDGFVHPKSSSFWDVTSYLEALP